jgi:hypothetical protein
MWCGIFEIPFLWEIACCLPLCIIPEIWYEDSGNAPLAVSGLFLINRGFNDA